MVGYLIWVRDSRVRLCAVVLSAVVVASAPAAGHVEQTRADLAQVASGLATAITRLQAEVHTAGARIDLRALLRAMTAVRSAEINAEKQFPAVFAHPYRQTFSPLQCVDGNLALSQAELLELTQGRLRSTRGGVLHYVSGLLLGHIQTANGCARSLQRQLHKRPPAVTGPLRTLSTGLQSLVVHVAPGFRRAETPARRAQLVKLAAVVGQVAARFPSVFGQAYAKTFKPLDCIATQIASGEDVLHQFAQGRTKRGRSYPFTFALARLVQAEACSVTLEAILSPAARPGTGPTAGVPSSTGAGGPAVAPTTPIYRDTSYSFAERAAELVSRMTLPEKVAQLHTNSAPAIPRLGIQQYTYWNEAQHGINALGADTNRGSAGGGPSATSFPTNFAAAMSWDPHLMYDETTAVSDEARGFLDKSLWNTGQNNLGPAPSDYGSLTFWAPTVNMDRDPRWGRTDEAFGEDPYLVSRMASAFVDGYQGQTLTGEPLTPYLKVAATAKHFALNDVEQNREAASSNVNDTDLHDYYTPQFERLIEDAHVAGLMTSLNAINGTPAMVDTYTTSQVAGRTYGFDGYTTTDCALSNVYRAFPDGHDWAPPGWITDGQDVNATWTNSTSGATVSGAAGAEAYALRSGTDLNCTGSQATLANVEQAISAGVLSEGVIDAALVRLFTMRMKTGEFDPASRVPYTAITKDAIQSPAHQALAEKVAANSLVLMKNDNVTGTGAPVLPVNPRVLNKVVILGDLANKVVLGGYSGAPSLKVSAVQGITSAVHAASPNASIVYDAGATSTTASSPVALSAATQGDITSADLVIVFVGTDAAVAGEGHDRSTLAMPGNYQSLIDQVAALGNPRMVLAIQSDGPLAIADEQAKFPAIVFSGYNGESQGAALADVLFGKQGPSGHLDFTWYAADSQLPAMSNYGLAPSATGGLGRTYMYFTGTPTYPFGYGLSYTRFSFSNLRITPQAVSADDTVSASFDVKNTGAAAGSTVAQLYVRSPRIAGVERPIKRLEGFEKTDVLQPGQTQTITMTVAARDLGFWNQPAARRQVDDGTYQFELGYDSDNIADSQTVAVTGGLTSHVKYVTVEPPAVVYKPGDTVDLTAKNPWLKDDTNPASEQRNLRVTGDGIVEAVNDDGSFLDLSRASVTYVSSNPNVATVSTRGVMTAVAPGVATLRVTVGGVTGSTVVAVKQPLALSGPPVALPGSSFTETETLVNTGSDTLRNLDLGLTAPSGWTAVPGSSTSVSEVPAGGSAQVTWTVRPPLGAAPGRYGLEASATSQTTRGESTVDSSADVALPYQSLAAAFNNAGVSDDANPASGNLDGGGRSYSMQALSAAGLTHSAVVTHDGLNFVWAGAAPGAPDNAVADGQAIPVTGRGTTLGFLGSGDYGTADGVGAIVYTDGSTQPFELAFADWWANRAARGGDILVTSPYVNMPSGKRQQPNNIYYAGVPLASGKTVQDVILPDVSQSPAVNQTTMHIFAVAIG